MTTWRSDGRALLRDERLVGRVDTPEIALEIVAAMRVVAAMIEPASGRERSSRPGPLPRHTRLPTAALCAGCPVITFAAWLLGAVLRAVVDGASKFRKIYREG